MMFDGIKLKTMFSTPEEWHALLIGLFEVLCPWKPHIPCHCERSEAISGEYHYYMAGRATGFVAFVYFCLGTAKFIKEVIL